MMPSKIIAETLLAKKAVTIRMNPPYTWTSGIQSPIYCDNRLLLSFPDARVRVLNAFYKLIKTQKLKPQIIAGTATAGIPWGALVAEKLKLPFIYVRKDAKGHGKGNKIEGLVAKGKKVLLIEDLISTGGSSIDCGRAIKLAGMKVLGVAAIFTYELPIAERNFRQARLPLFTLTNFPTLVSSAVQKKYLAKKDHETVLAWAKNPAVWRA
jgi:orotate phosphoribosyltransferase